METAFYYAWDIMKKNQVRTRYYSKDFATEEEARTKFNAKIKEPGTKFAQLLKRVEYKAEEIENWKHTYGKISITVLATYYQRNR